MMAKKTFFTLRFSEQERTHIETLAASENLTIGEYIRRRLFDDHVIEPEDDENASIAQINNEHDKNIMRAALTTFVLAKNLAKLQLPEQQYKEAMERAKETLKDWGYE